MTSEVMENRRPEVIVPAPLTKENLMTRNLALALVTLATFGTYSIYVVVTEGPLGFVSLALQHGWGMQMLLDIFVSLGVASLWLVPDAKARGINPWPYLVACVGLGSIAALGYVVHRELRGASAARALTT